MESSTLASTTPVVSETAGNQLDVRLRAGVLSLVIGVILLACKYFAYRLTGSTAILSDALESIVNVIAALFAIAGLTIARWPADRSHPYGHGKIEFFSAAFEGGLIAFAALLIVYQGVQGLLFGLEIHSLNVGVLITLGAGLANGALGWFLIRTGKQHNSLTLVADGKHVMSDFVTSLGVTVGLGLVLLTGRIWLDPLIAVIVGFQLAFTGFGLVRHAADGLLDAEDRGLLKRLLDAISANLQPGIIRVHFLRAIRSGRFTHVDAHLVIPEFWTVEKAHEVGDAFEKRVIDALPFEGEIVFHVDPCQRRYCSMCDVADCPIREAPFEGRTPLTLDEVTRREDPKLQS
jgi:cation diffusion facilitator family transporter